MKYVNEQVCYIELCRYCDTGACNHFMALIQPTHVSWHPAKSGGFCSSQILCLHVFVGGILLIQLLWLWIFVNCRAKVFCGLGTRC